MLVDLWRPWIEEKAADQLDHLGERIEDQAAFARLSRDLIAALDMADELGEDPDESGEDQEQGEEGGEGQSEERQEGEQQDAESAASEDTERSDSDMQKSMEEAAEIDTDDVPEDFEAEESPEGDQPWRPQLPFGSSINDDFYKVYSNQFDEVIAPRSCATPRSWRGCAAISTSSSPRCRAWWRGSPTGCSAG